MTGRLLEYSTKFFIGKKNGDVIHAGVHYLKDGAWNVATEETKIRSLRKECNRDANSKQIYHNHPESYSNTIYCGGDVNQAPKYLFVEGHPKFKHTNHVKSPPDLLVITHVDDRADGQCCPSCQGQLCKEYREEFGINSEKTTLFPCGGSLVTGELCFLDGRDCHLNANVYYIGVYRVGKDCKTTCKIGVVKTLYYLVGYFVNRYCIIQSIQHHVAPSDGEHYHNLRKTLIDKICDKSSGKPPLEKKRRVDKNNAVNSSQFRGLSKMYHGVLSDNASYGKDFPECFVMKGGGVARAMLLDRFGSDLVAHDP